ncbi:MAG: hypothetical protein OEN56_01050 [Gemmatimonadota bacterium]|nr:hypothetical protein [Gemmatimonadota bacterium]
MQMSFEYLRGTVDFFSSRGFTVQVEEETIRRDDREVYTTVRHSLERGAEERFALSCVRYPDGKETFWLEIRDFHGLRTFDTELDSWQHREDSVEFKYYPRQDGVGLSFILDLPPS